MAGFWELPAPERFHSLPETQIAGSFRHTIVNTRYIIQVLTAPPPRSIRGLKWFSLDELDAIPVTTISRKALLLADGASSR
jgi:hypothetical protein